MMRVDDTSGQVIQARLKITILNRKPLEDVELQYDGSALMMRCKKTAQITVRIDATLKEAAEKAAAQDHRSLTALIERLLSKHLRSRGFLSAPKRPHKGAARAALKLALREIETVGDRSLPAQERESRKRHLDDRFHEPDHGTGDLLVDSSFAVR